MSASPRISPRPQASPSWGRRRAHALTERRPAWKAGLLGTVVAHLILVLLVFFAPEDWMRGDLGETDSRSEGIFEIELEPLLLRPEEATIEPPRFVEVNPAAPENPPDKSPFVGAQNQQVAQPEPTPEGESDVPQVDGDGGANTTAIVSGDGKEPAPPSVAELLENAFQTEQTTKPSEVDGRAVEESETRRAVNAPGGGLDLLGSAEGDTGATVTRLPPVDGAETGREPKPGDVRGTSSGGGYFSGTPRIDRHRPQERPRLPAASLDARSTPTIKNEFGSKNIGAAAYNAKWSAYGEYMQRMIDAVQAQWDRLLMRSSYYPTSGVQVKVVFRLDAKGEVEIVQVDGSGGHLARGLCVSAVAERAPYGEWTDDMVAVLGREQEITFTFHYQ